MTPAADLREAFRKISKSQRDANQPFSIRVWRAISWLERAESFDASDPEGRFISTWIGFNALYGRLDDEGKLDMLPMKPQRVYAELRRVLPANTAIVFDAGGSSAYGYDRLDFSGPRTMFGTVDLGCIGAALPQAIGVKMARPDQPVISISGDGAFFMNAQELETSVRWKVPVVNIVMNNGSWGSEKAYQKLLYGERYMEADIGNPRYDKLAELCGGRGYYVEKPEDVGPAISDALASGEMAVIEIPIDPDELPYPARAADAFKSRGS